MGDLLRIGAHIAGIALTISLIPLAAVLTVFVHPAWGAVCLLAAFGAVWFAARLDRHAHEPRRDPVDAHYATAAEVLSEPTMRLDAAALRSTLCPPPPWLPAPPRALSGQDATLPFGMAVYDPHTPPQPWFPLIDEERR